MKRRKCSSSIPAKNSSFRLKLKQILLLLTAAFLLPLLLMLSASPSLSNEAQGQEHRIIPIQDVINDDLYLAAETITIDGTIKGDAVVAANQITLNGVVEGDLIAAAQVITVNGTVNDDVRMAGQVLILGESARIKDDVVAAGYSLENKAGSAIGGNLNYFGGQALLAGAVQQNVRGAVNALQIAGQVNGNLNTIVGSQSIPPPPLLNLQATFPTVQPGLTLTDTAQVRGNVTYRSASTAQIASGATVTGQMVYKPMKEVEHSTNWAYWTFFQIQRWAVLLLVGWILLRFVPDWIQNLGAAVQRKPFPALGWGIVVMLGVIAGTIALSFSTAILSILSALILPSLALPIFGIGSLLLLALLIGFSIVASFIPAIVVSFWGGKRLMAKLYPDRPVQNLVALGVGILVFVILTAIPVIGSILNTVAIFVGLGALWIGWRRSGKRSNIAPEPPLAAV